MRYPRTDRAFQRDRFSDCIKSLYDMSARFHHMVQRLGTKKGRTDEIRLWLGYVERPTQGP